MSDIEMPDVIGATRRAETIRQGMISYAAAMDAIGEAYEARDWVTLKYPDWDTYCEKEFSEKRLKLTRAQREQAVIAFRGAGMSTRAIASALGVSDGTVRNDLAGAQNYAPAEVRGADGKTYAPTKPAAQSEPPETSGLVDDTSPVDESGEDRPATGTLGEAEDASHASAADVTTPSATPTDSDSSPEESESVDEPEEAALGVTLPAPVPQPADQGQPPTWLVAITAVCGAVHELAGEDPLGVAEEIDSDLAAELGVATSRLLAWYKAMQKAANGDGDE